MLQTIQQAHYDLFSQNGSSPRVSACWSHDQLCDDLAVKIDTLLFFQREGSQLEEARDGSLTLWEDPLFSERHPPLFTVHHPIQDLRHLPWFSLVSFVFLKLWSRLGLVCSCWDRAATWVRAVHQPAPDNLTCVTCSMILIFSQTGQSQSVELIASQNMDFRFPPY